MSKIKIKSNFIRFYWYYFFYYFRQIFIIIIKKRLWYQTIRKDYKFNSITQYF